jgi:hypothetical protein
MKISTELMIFAFVGAIFGWFIVPDEVGKFSVFTMAFVLWVASRICAAIEQKGGKQ